MVYANVNNAISLPAPFTFGVVTAPMIVWLAAVAGALLTFGAVLLFYLDRCGSHDTAQGCSAGVVQGAVPSFNSTSDDLFPFTAMPDRLDVVVKCDYWGIVSSNAAWIWCNNDTDSSPMTRCYYKTEQVCEAGLGATIGAGVGALAGILVGAAVGAAIGCATIVFCILAILVALLVAAAVVLFGAFMGGQIGKANAAPGSITATDGNVVLIGDYVTTCGGLLTSGNDNGARVYWFVDKTVQHAPSMAPQPYSHTDPDANLNPDACPSCVIIQ
jgi:hypothetical protein